MSPWNKARLGLLVALLIFSGLLFYSPEQVNLFKAALLAREFGVYYAGLSLLLACLPFRRSFFLLALLTASLFLKDEIHSLWGEAELPSRFSCAFGKAPAAPAKARYSVRQLKLTYDSLRGLRLNFWRPEALSSTACLLVLHSGGWDGGSREEFSDWNRDLAARGIAVASLDYRLAPQDPWPAPEEDVLKARAWLQVESKALGLDGKRFVILGRSAGAQIALMSAYQNPRQFNGVLDFYGPSDLSFAYEHSHPGDLFEPLTLLSQEFGESPQTKGNSYASASPLLAAKPGLPPSLILHGLDDQAVWPVHSERLSDRLANSHDISVYVPIPWGLHGCDFYRYGPSGRLAFAATLDFLSELGDLN